MNRAVGYTFWLIIVVSGLFLSITRFRDYGIWGVAGIVIGSGMLILFCTDHLLSQRRRSRFREQVADFTVLLVITIVFIALATSLFFSLFMKQWTAAFVFGVFAFAFARILIEYLAHLQKKYRSRRLQSKS